MTLASAALPRWRASDLRLLWPAMVGWAVLAASLALSARAAALVAGVCGLTAALLFSSRRSRGVARDGCGAPGASMRGVLTLALLVVALLEVALAGHVLLRSSGRLDELAASRASADVDVVVTGEPVVLTGHAADHPLVLVRADAVAIRSRGALSLEHAPVLLRGDEGLLRLRWHETVRVSGRLAPTDPGAAEAAAMRVTRLPQPLEPPGWVARSAERLRAGLRTALDPAPADARGLLPGLVIGDTSRTPEDLTEAMRATGMTHLTAVSGSNVAVTLALVAGLCTLLGVPRRLRPPLCLLALAGFVVLARPEPSVVRAATMGAIALLGLSRSRPSAGLPVLSGAILVILVLDPWMARSYGFALSTLATVGLLLFTRPWGDAVGERLPARLRRCGHAIAIPVAAQVMCAPVIVLLQGSVSLVGVVANLVAAPLVAPATIAGVAAAVLSVVAEPLARLAGWVGVLPTLGIARTARALADVPGGTLPWPDGAGGALLLAALTVVLLLTGRRLAHVVTRHPLVATAVASLVAALATPTAPFTWPPPGWLVVFCDVGQGDAAVVRTGPHSGVLVDAGPDPALVDRCLHRLDVTRLDAVVLTHFHADHVGGFPGAVSGRDVGEVLVTPTREPAYQAREVEQWTAERGLAMRPLSDGLSLTHGSMSARVWSPARRIEAGSVPNNASVVLAVRVSGLDALLMGDIEREAAHDLLLRIRRDPGMGVTAHGFEVVKSPHHGSSNLDPDLMATVAAPVAVVSVGADNDYGHPTREHLELLRRVGSAVYRTDQRGAVAMVETAAGVGVVTER